MNGSRVGRRVIQVFLVLALSPLLSACLIVSYSVTQGVSEGGTIRFNARVVEPFGDSTPWRGVQMMLIPTDWTLLLAEYTASDSGGLIGSGSLVESTDWADSAAVGVGPPPPGMRWLGLISDVAYSHSDSLQVETALQFRAGAPGTYSVGIVVTKESYYPGLGDWFGDRPNSLIGADSTMNILVTVQPSVEVNLKVFLEGTYSDHSLSSKPGFLPLIPLSQPFSDAAYDGTELEYDSSYTVSSLPVGTVDWVLIALRQNLSFEQPGGRQVGFVTSDGSIVDSTGSYLSFPGVPRRRYHAVVMHRNHLGVMSSGTLATNVGVGSWDFTGSLEAAYSPGPPPMKDLGGGNYGMFACDINHDGHITASDFNSWLVDAKAAATGYLASDCNLDGQTTASDFNLWLVNTKAATASQVLD